MKKNIISSLISLTEEVKFLIIETNLLMVYLISLEMKLIHPILISTNAKSIEIFLIYLTNVLIGILVNTMIVYLYTKIQNPKDISLELLSLQDLLWVIFWSVSIYLSIRYIIVNFLI